MSTRAPGMSTAIPAPLGWFLSDDDSNPEIIVSDEPAAARTISAPVRSIDGDESACEILSAEMQPSGIQRAFGALDEIRRFGPFEEFALATDDHGVGLEFSRPNSSKELAVVIPEDGSMRFFTARANNFRKAGVILDDLGIRSLAAWAASEEAEFSERGLQVSSGRPGPRP
ncbi:MAG TPA: hypothetical protein VHL80_14495 [Polyangia bacterium]|nr:hypothetical protein [Polyangia bacterium]